MSSGTRCSPDIVSGSRCWLTPLTLTSSSYAHRAGTARPLATFLAVRRRRTIWHKRVPSFMVGWPTWLANRRAGLRDRYFRLVTRSAYRGQPGRDQLRARRAPVPRERPRPAPQLAAPGSATRVDHQDTARRGEDPARVQSPNARALAGRLIDGIGIRLEPFTLIGTARVTFGIVALDTGVAYGAAAHRRLRVAACTTTSRQGPRPQGTASASRRCSCR